ncbi:uncharacterized protein LOC142231103 [Haematobia irritans]|uniref:uncharacterized protein LOC142231103 n=1 Tax=Haematobia irritans TaxID=7368 RepID=UPI003F501E77
MPRIIKNRPSLKNPRSTKFKRVYKCRVCNDIHPLRLCKRFLAMNPSRRRQEVERHGYCLNCLAHKHSKLTCFSKSGCRKCNHKHHTLLHRHEDSGSEIAPIELARKSLKVESQQMVTVLPTILAKLSINGRLHPIRILVDTASTVSRISRAIVLKYDIPTKGMEDSIVCTVTIFARTDKKVSFTTLMRGDNRISLKTPGKTLPKSIQEKFHNLVLADPLFFKNDSISMIFGSDIYSKILCDGIMPNADGLATAQNSTFGWIVSGRYPV